MEAITCGSAGRKLRFSLWLGPEPALAEHKETGNMVLVIFDGGVNKFCYRFTIAKDRVQTWQRTAGVWDKAVSSQPCKSRLCCSTLTNKFFHLVHGRRGRTLSGEILRRDKTLLHCVRTGSDLGDLARAKS